MHAATGNGFLVRMYVESFCGEDGLIIDLFLGYSLGLPM